MGVPLRNRISPVDDLGVLERVLDSMPAAQIARFLQELPDTVVLAGGRRLEPALHASGRRVVLAEEGPAGIPDDAIVVWERVFDAEGYEAVAELKRRFPGRVTTAFELLSKASLFQAVGELIGYHQAKGNEARLIDIMSGATPEPWGYLGELDKLYPIVGKRVIEYGPLDGAMTATLLQLGAASVTGVEIRMTNVIKLLAAAHIFGWGDRFRLLVEDMHMVDASSAGRFDLAVAHGVYYHSIRPFHFLQNLATVADTLFIGGFVADPERLRSPLVELDHDGDVYRAQHYVDKLDNDGGGAHADAYYFMPEDLVLFMERQGFSVETLQLIPTTPNKAAGRYLRILCRRRIPAS